MQNFRKCNLFYNKSLFVCETIAYVIAKINDKPYFLYITATTVEL